MSPKGSNSADQTVITPHFKFVARIVVGMTAASGLVYMSVTLLIPNPSAEVKTLLTVASMGWQSGSGAFFGLLGGKSMHQS